MTPPRPIGAMSSGRVFLGELLASRARLRFPGHAQAQPSTPVRQANPSERQTGLLLAVSRKGVTLVWARRTKTYIAPYAQKIHGLCRMCRLCMIFQDSLPRVPVPRRTYADSHLDQLPKVDPSTCASPKLHRSVFSLLSSPHELGTSKQLLTVKTWPSFSFSFGLNFGEPQASHSDGRRSNGNFMSERSHYLTIAAKT